MKSSGNTILITGGGSGIGAALAHRFHDAGNTVIVAGRRRDALEATIAGRPNLHAMVLDLETPEAIEAFARDLIAAHPALNILFNNAGVMQHEEIDSRRDLTAAEAMITTNLLGPVRLTNALVDHLKAQPNAAIVNVTSGLAFVPLSAAATYSATKAAIHSYTVSLRDVLAGQVEVIEMAPPATQTDLTPGQRTREGYQPLEEFADEVFALFGQMPTPREVLVERVKFLRNAEIEGRFDAALVAITELATGDGH